MNGVLFPFLMILIVIRAPNLRTVLYSIERKRESKSLLHIDIESLFKSRYLLHAKIDLVAFSTNHCFKIENLPFE